MKCRECGQDRERSPPPDCALCGLTCDLGGAGANYGGLLNHTVSGNYDSTAGNGYGALDDGDTYTFSLCEWCLDWLFGQFKTPPTMGNYMSSEAGEAPEAFRSAAERVCSDEWRQAGRVAFMAELKRRNVARAK